jgi:hypothetical protein
MKPIPLKLLNKRVTIARPSVAIGDTGSTVGASTNLYTNVPIRITKAKGDNDIKEQGAAAQSSYLGFCRCTIIVGEAEVALTIKTGYLIIDGTKKYKVDFVDDEPGGVFDHHKEIYMSILGK